MTLRKPPLFFWLYCAITLSCTLGLSSNGNPHLVSNSEESTTKAVIESNQTCLISAGTSFRADKATDRHTSNSSKVVDNSLNAGTADESSVTLEKKKKKRKSSVRTKPLSTTQTTFVRRVQREWKDAVQMGIAYDWVKGKPIVPLTPKKDATVEDSAQEKEPYHLCMGPLGKNLFIWHFSLAGVSESAYEGGIYHGRLMLSPQYPSVPPRVQLWTPSGRFVPQADICLSASAFHPETWNPSAWNLRTLIESLRLHFLTQANEIGGTTTTSEEKRKFAVQSRSWKADVPLTSANTKSSGRNRLAQRYVRIDHARMIQQRSFARLPAEEDMTDNLLQAEVASSDSIVLPSTRILERQRSRNKSSAVGILMATIRKLFASPQRYALLGLFIWLFSKMTRQS